MLAQRLEPEELAALKADFHQYKDTGVPPDTFGRDAPYDMPGTLPSVRAEDIWHLHLANARQPWPPNATQYHRTSDHHLVYCRGFFHADHFLLMAFLSPDAHAQALNNGVMHALAQMAARFRATY